MKCCITCIHTCSFTDSFNLNKYILFRHCLDCYFDKLSTKGSVYLCENYEETNDTRKKKTGVQNIICLTYV